MTDVFSTVPTPWLLAAEQAFAAGGPAINLGGGTLKVGDGAGVVPTASAIIANGGVLHQVWQGPVNGGEVDASNALQINVNCLIPTVDGTGAEIGPFTVREFAIYDASGNLALVGTTNLPKTVSSSGQPTTLQWWACYAAAVANSVTVQPPPGSFPTLAQVQAAIAALLGLSGKAPGGLIGRRKFTSTQYYTPSPGTNSVVVHVVAAGGPGGGSQAMPAGNFATGGGGGAGGEAISLLTSGFSGVLMTLGAAGAPAVGSGGGAGGATSFGGLLSATAGGSGASGAAVPISSIQTGGPGGVGSGGNLFNGVGASGLPGIAFASGNEVSGAGAASSCGAGGGSVFTGTSAGNPASSYGAGGGGASGQSGGAAQAGGAAGGPVIFVDEYA